MAPASRCNLSFFWSEMFLLRSEGSSEQSEDRPSSQTQCLEAGL